MWRSISTGPDAAESVTQPQGQTGPLNTESTGGWDPVRSICLAARSEYGITTSIVANAAASAVSIRQNMNKRRSLQPLVSTWAVFVLKLPKSFCVVI